MEDLKQNKINIYIITIIILLIILFHAILLFFILYFDTVQKIDKINLPNKKFHKIFTKNLVKKKDADIELPNVKAKSGIPIFLPNNIQKEKFEKIEENTKKSLIKTEDLFKQTLTEAKKKNLIETKSNNKNKTQIAKPEAPEKANQVSEEKNDINDTKFPEQLLSIDKLPTSPKLHQTRGTNGREEITKNIRRTILSYEDSNKPILPRSFVEGFLNGQNGTHTFSYQSNNSSNEKNIKNVCYMDKIFSFMQNSWNVIKQKLNYSNPISTTVGISLVLDKNGNIVSLEKTYSSPYQEIDDIVLETIKFAAPYPPIPNHMNKDTFTISTHIRVSISKKFI